jgi:hypothetical protein
MQIAILERGEDGEIYFYFEDPEHHAVVNHNPDSGRSLADRVEIDTDNECLVPEQLAPGQWTSFIAKSFEVPKRIWEEFYD